MIIQKVTAKPFSSNTEDKKTFRIIGSLDIDGKGTEHELASVDPFILLDETVLNSNQSWPFPKHPHCGLVAMTYLLSGDIQPWDNHQGKVSTHNKAGGIYYINSGNGLLHEEEPIQNGAVLRWLQLWMNPGIDSKNLPKASTQLVKPEHIPVHETNAGIVRIMVGEAFQKTSPLQSDWPILYLHVTLHPKQNLDFQIPNPNWQGFCYLLQGNGFFSDVSAAKFDCITFKSADRIMVKNTDASEPLEFVLACGKPHHRPLYKIHCGGGSLILDSEAAARSAKQRYESDPENFGH